MRRVSQFLAPELARTSLSAVVSDIRDSMMEETDLRKEAANIDAFTAFLEQSGLTAYAKAPFVFRDAWTRQQKMRSDGNYFPSGSKVLTQGLKEAAAGGPK